MHSPHIASEALVCSLTSFGRNSLSRRKCFIVCLHTRLLFSSFKNNCLYCIYSLRSFQVGLCRIQIPNPLTVDASIMP